MEPRPFTDHQKMAHSYPIVLASCLRPDLEAVRLSHGNLALTEMILLKVIFSLSWQKFLSGLSIRECCAFPSLVFLTGSADFVSEDVSLALRAR